MQVTTNGILTILSATELARQIARGDVSSSDVVEAHIQRIERVNPALKAVVVKRYDAARAEAREADRRRLAGEALGPLHGVPVTVKECLDLAGTPSTFGLPVRARENALGDDPYKARLRAAGAIVLGMTNVAQLLFYLESDNPVYGRTNNPWNVDRTPGGSSGGQAAIIAAGGTPRAWQPTSAAASGFRPPFAASRESSQPLVAPLTSVGTTGLLASKRSLVRLGYWPHGSNTWHLASKSSTADGIQRSSSRCRSRIRVR